MDSKEYKNALKIGTKLHWYKIKAILGQGGFGITYLAKDMNLEKDVAIKEYLPSDLSIRESDNSVNPISSDTGNEYITGLERFIKEARTLSKFNHPNIVKVHAVFEENNTGYMVMSYEHGLSLKDKIADKNKLTENELLTIVFKILDGLKIVHDNGFIHRDIKPDNIYLIENGEPVLLDFGSARYTLGVKSKSITSIISQGYAPLEQYEALSNDIGPWTDIYSVGATLYRCATGITPMDPLTRSNAVLRKKKDPYVSIRDLLDNNYSDRFCFAIDHALKLKHEDRPVSISKWLDDFSNDNFASNGNIAGESVTDVYIPPKASIKTSSKYYLFITAAISIFIICVLGFYIYSKQHDIYDNDEILAAYEKYMQTDFYNALPIIKKYSDKGNIRAKFLLAMLHMQGYATNYDDDLAIKLIQEIELDTELESSNGELWAKTNLGLMYLGGWSVEKNQELALKLTREAAQKNFPRAIHNLAVFYSGGIVINQNDKEAIKLYEKASRLGMVLSDLELAKRYINGIGLEQDINKAINIYEDAATNGSDLAKIGLATVYVDGTEKKYEEARNLFFEVTKHNYSLAYSGMGYINQFGLGVDIDANESFKWYKMAAENNHLAAIVKIAYFYDQGFGVEIDKKLSIKWIEKAAVLGHVISQGSLAFNYLNGEIINKDIKKSIHWFTEAANAGNNISQFMLGAIYSDDKNYTKSFEYYKLATDNGHQSAPYYLGLFYRNGTGVNRDNQKATEFFKKAYENGYVPAQVEYAYALERGIGVTRNIDLAFDLYLDAAEKGNADAQNNIGYFYLQGVGTLKNYDKAIEWYEKSAEQNHQLAIDKLSELKKKNIQREDRNIDLSKYKHIIGTYSGILQSSVYGKIYAASVEIYIENNQLKSTYRNDDDDEYELLIEIKSDNSSGITIELNGIDFPINALVVLRNNELEGNYNSLIDGQEDRGTFKFLKEKD